VEKVISEQSSVSSGKMTKREYLLESGRGQRLLQGGRAGEAEGVFRALLSRLEGEAEDDTRYDQTLILRNIGLSLHAQGRPSQAADCYRRAIALAEGLEQDKDVKRQTAAYHVDLADVLTDSGQYANARTEYEFGLKVIREIDDDRSEGAILGQLGTLAMRQGDLNEARVRYLEALGLFQRMGEDQMEAVAWHQLGRVAQKACDWDEAERCYKQSLTIKENLGDWALVATSYNQLAIVAEGAGRKDEAERWYKRTLEYADLLPDHGARPYSYLADLLLSAGQIDQAEIYAHKAKELIEKIDLYEESWRPYSTLAQIAEKRGRMEEARAWRRKEQESFAAFAGSDTQIKQFEPLIAAIVAACQGNEEAKNALENEYPKMKAGSPDWIETANAIQKIVAGERDPEKLLAGAGSQSGLVIRRVLQALSEAPGPHRPAATSPIFDEPQSKMGEAGGGGFTLPQLLDLVERAARGDQQLGGQLFGAFQQMARAEDETTSALGDVLLRVLIGDRNPNLAALPDELASAVRGLLGRLKNK